MLEFQIGHFSIMTRMPVKTLRYYHEIGLLVPHRVDEMTGYRYYTPEQTERAQTITQLRSLEFSLTAIGEILHRIDSGESIESVVSDKHQEVQHRLSELIALDAQLRQMGPAPRVGQVEVRQIPGELVASVRFLGRYDEIGSHLGQLGGAVGRLATGPPYTLYWIDEYLPDKSDIEVCVPITRVADVEGITCRVVPAADCVSTIHAGSYETLHDSYSRAFAYISGNNLDSSTPIRERYLKDPIHPDVTGPDDYLTEIAVPVTGRSE
jgi:DNA-binding transcriptional MerR regulator